MLTLAEKQMSNKYKFRSPDELNFVSFTVVYWIDLFIRNEYKDILLESWKYCMNKKGLQIFGWCIMTSHAHMIIGSENHPMDAIMRDMKKFTSGMLPKAIQNNPAESRRDWLLNLMNNSGQKNCHNKIFQLWQQDNHPMELTTPKIMHQKLDYIHDNPVKAGFVEKPEDYLYSSARNYYGMRGLIEIQLLDPILE